jgi:hypothetical protein
VFFVSLTPKFGSTFVFLNPSRIVLSRFSVPRSGVAAFVDTVSGVVLTPLAQILAPVFAPVFGAAFVATFECIERIALNNVKIHASTQRFIIFSP